MTAYKLSHLIASTSLLAIFAMPSHAQEEAPPALEVETPQGPEVVTVDVNEQRVVAIPALVTPNVVRTNAGSTAQLGENIAKVIADNLNNSGIFNAIGPDGVKKILARPQCRSIDSRLCPKRRWRQYYCRLLSL
jgi:hypothetical protein